MINKIYTVFFFLMVVTVVHAHHPKNLGKQKETNKVLKPRENCSPASKQIDQDINNVRARLLNGGDVWNDLNRKGRYIVPKIEPGSGKPEVSSIYNGCVWIGGYDPSGSLKFMGQSYRSSTENDAWPGPLSDEGETTISSCLNWDKFFRVSGDNIRTLQSNWLAAVAEGRTELRGDEIPNDIKYYPCRGNKNFESFYGFPLPDTRAGLALFDDLNNNRTYEPEFGEYPIIDIRGCPVGIFPDDMIFWIYNDNGGIHTNSKGEAIRMEVQVQAFAFRTSNELNDMTFQRYKLVNRAIQDIRDCYFAMWIDPDLGCYSDDYIGCDTSFTGKYDSITGRPIRRDLMYIYNIDATDGSNGCTCDQSVNTYCNDVPILGVDYFRGPVDANGHELGMTTFMYYNGLGLGGNPDPNTTDPTTAQEHYYYITGKWRNGTPLTNGGKGYNPGSNDSTHYAFPSPPNKQGGWSMCQINEGEGDRRTIQATGPLLLTPGNRSELIIGVPWVPNQTYPCPSLEELLKADQLCQDLFDNCFDLKDGPSAPNVDFVELDRELIMILSNVKGSNNFNETYSEKGIGIPPGVDSLYRFEGYRIFQLANENVSLSDQSIGDVEQIREIYNVDLKNGVKKLYDWAGVKNPTSNPKNPIVYYPILKVEGSDNGIRHSFRITEDAFATGINRRLLNHKKYYYLVIAYSYNNYKDYDVELNSGQRMQYCPGRLNIGPKGNGKPYIVTPRPQIYEVVNSNYGDGFPVTRYEGIGTGNTFLQLNPNTYDKILDGTSGGKIEYLPGASPIEVKVVNPLKVTDGEYEIRFTDINPTNNKLDAPVTWTLKGITDPSLVVNSSGSIENFSEQVISKIGISVSLGQVEETGKDPYETNGIIGTGLKYTYKDLNGKKWFVAQPDRGSISPFLNFIRTDPGPFGFNNLDPNSLFEKLGYDLGDTLKGTWYPYKLITGDTLIFTPAWINALNKSANNSTLADLNNVDIVLTSDKSKWSRCVVIETWNKNAGDDIELNPVSNLKSFNLKENLFSVGKNDADGDGKADRDFEKDGTGKDLTGMGWFPGYAVDVESGKRLNIFFGENSIYSNFDLFKDCLDNGEGTGNDLMWNPTGQITLNGDACGFAQSFLNFVVGGHHWIYVTKQDYDECKKLRTDLIAAKNTAARMAFVIRDITWCSAATLLNPSTKLDPLGNGTTGLIPNDLTVNLRVRNPYQYAVGTNDNNGHNLYRFTVSGKAPGTIAGKGAIEDAMNDVNVVPNPYYGFSNYEATQFQNIVKITNLPAKCVVTIYAIDGKFIKQYKRDEKPLLVTDPLRGVTEKQITPDLEWDLTNFKGIPISSGAYLVHILQPDTGAEKIVKWFGVARKFDPSGL